MSFDPDRYIENGMRNAERFAMRRSLMAKKERFIVTTPIAELGYGYLRFADTKFNPDGDYKQDFFLDSEAAKQFVASIEKDPRAAVKGKPGRLKFTKVDGQIKFKTKQHAKVTDKGGTVYDMKPRLYYVVDGQTVPYPEDAPNPWSGSKGELELEVVPFDGFGGGLTLRLRAIRLLEIVEGTKSAGGNWGAVDEGYTSGSTKRTSTDVDEPELDDPDEVEEDEEEERW